jgi:hypothetical protein
VSQVPHHCYGRELLVRTAYIPENPNEYPSNSSPEQFIQTTPFLSTNETFNSTTMDDSSIFDDNKDDRLASLRDELEANLECMQIAHEHEINLLREKLKRETKLRKEADESYKEAEEDWKKENTENIRLRTSLIKNVMQTFNIRKTLSRQTKDQLRECAQMEKQCEDIKSNRMSSSNSKTILLYSTLFISYEILDEETT